MLYSDRTKVTYRAENVKIQWTSIIQQTDASKVKGLRLCAGRGRSIDSASQSVSHSVTHCWLVSKAFTYSPAFMTPTVHSSPLSLLWRCFSPSHQLNVFCFVYYYSLCTLFFLTCRNFFRYVVWCPIKLTVFTHTSKQSVTRLFNRETYFRVSDIIYFCNILYGLFSYHFCFGFRSRSRRPYNQNESLEKLKNRILNKLPVCVEKINTFVRQWSVDRKHGREQLKWHRNCKWRKEVWRQIGK